MKFFYCFAVLIFFSSCNRMAYEERLERKGKIKCGWYGKMTTEERRNAFPFNQAHKIVLISYPNYATKYVYEEITTDRKSTRLNSSHLDLSRMPSSA